MDDYGVADVTGRRVSVAASLMRMALALLDRADEDVAAARLQHALDALEHLRHLGPLKR